MPLGPQALGAPQPRATLRTGNADGAAGSHPGTDRPAGTAARSVPRATPSPGCGSARKAALGAAGAAVRRPRSVTQTSKNGGSTPAVARAKISENLTNL